MIHIHLSFPNPLTHLIHIEIKMSTEELDSLEMILPAWRPGRYELAPFAENIQQYSVKGQDGALLQSKKTAPNVWTTQVNGTGHAIISYQYYAHKMDAGNSVINDELIYINFINCIMFSSEHTSEEFEVKINLPNNYEHTCSLAEFTKNNFNAPSYQHLVDAPILASANLKKIGYQIAETQFTIAITGDCPLSEDMLIADFRKFTESQITAMDGFPSKNYTFIILSLDYKHYHGVEHQDNTVLVLGPNDPDSHDEYREKLMGVASHELFHAWNVTRIRPAEMCPYQFKEETITETGFVTEGFTTYYGDLFLMNSGYFLQKDYFKEVNLLLKRHFENYGRHESSLVESSRSLWVDGYKAVFPSKKVSIYVKGALCALILDLTIRKNTHQEKSLIDVLKKLMGQHTVGNGGYTKSEALACIETIGGSQIRTLIQQLYESTDDLHPILIEALKNVGLKLVAKQHHEMLASHFGIQCKGDLIVAIAPMSIAEHSLSVGDRIEMIDGKVFNAKSVLISDSTSFQIKRGAKTLTLSLEKNGTNYYSSYELEKISSPNETQKKNLRHWLGIN